jgi:hypothetical protein
MSLALEVRQTPMRVVDCRGEETLGAIFLHTVGEVAMRPETVRERLNEAGVRFLPLRRGEAVELVNLGSISYVGLAGRPPEVESLESVGAQRARVEVELAFGEWLRGDFVFERPAGSARVSDLLNAGEERFLLLLTESETLFVNRDAIVRVKAG